MIIKTHILIVLISLMVIGFPTQYTVTNAKAQQKSVKRPKSAKSGKLCFQLGRKRYNQTKQPLFGSMFKRKKTYTSKKPSISGEALTSEKAQSKRQHISKVAKSEVVSKTSGQSSIEESESKKMLPATVSDKHARIREEVEQSLANQRKNEALEIEPLYFITGQEEFAFMDMDPFLKAVEFALQGKMILVEGHTDSKGDAEKNLQLSMRRVDRIKQLMIDIGVSEALISVIGYGETEPLHDNNTEEGRQKNRRVDFKVF